MAGSTTTANGELKAVKLVCEIKVATGPAVRPPAVMAGVAPSNGAGGRDEEAERNIRQQVEQLADNDPDKVAQQLRSWMQES